MPQIEVQVFDHLPSDLAPASAVRFFPEYSAPHPLWLDTGLPDLDDLGLPPDLAARLRRWATYWDDTFHWDDGWPAGAPEAWWLAERDALPREVALAIGRDFAVQVDARFLRSRADARSEATAVALRSIHHAAAAEAAEVAATVGQGAVFTAQAGGVSYSEWLESQQRATSHDDDPVEEPRH